VRGTREVRFADKLRIWAPGQGRRALLYHQWLVSPVVVGAEPRASRVTGGTQEQRCRGGRCPNLGAVVEQPEDENNERWTGRVLRLLHGHMVEPFHHVCPSARRGRRSSSTAAAKAAIGGAPRELRSAAPAHMIHPLIGPGRPLYSLALATVASLQLQYVLSTGRWRLPAWLPARLAGSSSASAAGAGAERPPMSASSPLLSTGPASKTTAQHAEVPAAGGEGHVDPAAVDPFVASWGRFQWKIFGIAGGTGASFAGWILLPVFVDPMLQSWDGGVFTKGRTALLGSLFFAGWAVGAALSSPLADR
jgi:hypothetical protein